ncbi:WD repeat protein [Aspergillus ambiguus]|uniref:WD40 repeat domain-containing protein n=1 Tax=Aspergillus ambiguus TaxID=176160 RepID=UPI003CCC99D7
MSDPISQPRSPATPVYILRGHAAPIHGLHVFHQNLRLISGDAEGWVVVWDLVSKRPIASWKAHDGALLEVKGFSLEAEVTEVYTHGRDHKLRVWRLRAQDEAILAKTLPVDVAGQASSTQTQPWLVHSLPVNALNFCAFSMTFIDEVDRTPDSQQSTAEGDSQPAPSPAGNDVRRPAVLFAVPNALDSGAIDLFHLPSERRVCTIPADSAVKTGMVMAVNLVLAKSGELYVASAYEDGHVMVSACRGALREKNFSRGSKTVWSWEKLYFCRPHTQPALSIDVAPSGDSFLSSSADALLVKHPIPLLSPNSSPLQGAAEDHPLKQVNTKHSGQQGLRVRSDGKIFATAGWDSRVRVYSCKTLKELAVLKWHKDGCYAVAFADVASPVPECEAENQDQSEGKYESGAIQLTGSEAQFSLATVQRQRNRKVQNTHWLAAGSKDGKISLWDIY